MCYSSFSTQTAPQSFLQKCVRALISARLLTLQESNDKGLFKISVGKNNNNSLLPGVMDCGKQKRSRSLLSRCLGWWCWSFYAELGRRRANTVSGHELFPDCFGWAEAQTLEVFASFLHDRPNTRMDMSCKYRNGPLGPVCIANNQYSVNLTYSLTIKTRKNL